MGEKQWVITASGVVVFSATSVVFGSADALSNIVSHSSLFAPLGAAVPFGLNAKVFFEVGLLVSSLLLVVFPRFFEKWGGVLAVGSGVVLLVGVGLCLAGPAALFSGELETLLSIVVFGVGFMGVKFLAFYLLYLKCSLASAVMSIACGKVLKTALALVTLSLQPSGQLVLTLVLVGVALAGCVVLWRQMQRELVRDPEDWGALAGVSTGSLLGQSVLIAIILASIQAFTTFGTYGELDASSFVEFAAYFVCSLSVPALAWYFFVRQDQANLQRSYRNAFLLTLAALFVVAAQSSGTWILSEITLSILLNTLEMFCHVVYWAAVISACWAMRDRALQLMGGSIAVFALISLFWIVLLQNVSALATVVMLAVAYICFLAILKLFPRASIVKVTTRRLIDDEMLERIAGDHDLSPRETEVFLLLAQGRSRSYIQEALFISDGTVRTHIWRIYHKLGVENKQELVSMLLDRRDG